MLRAPSPPPPMGEMPQAIFLDRDGVINERRVNHVTRWEEFVFLPGVKAALARLAALRLPVYVVTNQAIINRGLVTGATVEAMHGRMLGEVAAAGGSIAAVAYCPHRPDEGCACRKPAPGMLHTLAARYRLDPARCLMVGDTCGDLLAGRAAGCRTALVLTGQGSEEHPRARSLGLDGFTVAPNFAALVRRIEAPVRAPPAYPVTRPFALPGEAAD